MLTVASCLCVALEIQGIFRLSGDNEDIQWLKTRFERGEEVDLFKVRDPHNVSGLLKKYIRELPDPIGTFALYPEWLAAAQCTLRDLLSPSNDELDDDTVVPRPPINRSIGARGDCRMSSTGSMSAECQHGGSQAIDATPLGGVTVCQYQQHEHQESRNRLCAESLPWPRREYHAIAQGHTVHHERHQDLDRASR